MKRQNIFSFYVREIVWCEFESLPSAQKPEFVGTHPAIILSIKNAEQWPHLVVPLTSQEQHCIQGTIVVIPEQFVPTNKTSYAICSHIYAVAHTRLKRHQNRKMRLSDELFEHVKAACCVRLPFIPETKD